MIQVRNFNVLVGGWCGSMSGSVCVILGKPGAGKLFLDLECVIIGKPGVRKCVLDLVFSNTREAWCRKFSLRSSVCVCGTREAWCRKIH